MDDELLKMLVCPETRTPLTWAEDSLIEQINTRITSGTLRNRNQQPITQKIDGGVVREDQQYLYPIRDHIPIMLVEESIPLNELLPAS